MQQINKKILQFFSSLADETRLRIVLSIMDEPKTVTQIHEAVNSITLSAISHQLTHLTNLDIVKFQKKGRKKFFELSDDFCWCILRDTLGHYGKTKCAACAEIRSNK